MGKILWMSRHKMTTPQIEALRHMYGADVEVEQEAKPFSDAREIVRRFKSGNYLDMVVVAPLSVLAVICQEGIKPLWSEAIEETDPNKIEFFGGRGKGFRFVRFRRIKKVALEFED
ncbi:MAG TPA: hypothetical protein PKM88_00695 [bacterium]|nr:hypothetical protein [bacterium]